MTVFGYQLLSLFRSFKASNKLFNTSFPAAGSPIIFRRAFIGLVSINAVNNKNKTICPSNNPESIASNKVPLIVLCLGAISCHIVASVSVYFSEPTPVISSISSASLSISNDNTYVFFSLLIKLPLLLWISPCHFASL